VLSEIRVRSRITAEAMEQRKKKVLTDVDHDIRLTGPTRVMGPDGRPLAVYLPGAVKDEMDAAYPVLTTIRGLTENRGYASGTEQKFQQNNLQRAKPVMSSILGSFEASGFYKYCRLTSWTAQEMESRWPTLLPLFQRIAGHFAERVPDRYQAQMKYAGGCAPDWMIDGTPFTTITVNNTYSTGVHQDKGDLDEGFSCLAVARRGDFSGGKLTFPEYRVAVDLQDGDLILMDAHAWHGNTAIRCTCLADPQPEPEWMKVLSEEAAADIRGRADLLGDMLAPPPEDKRRVLSDGPCPDCGAERISVVCYFRTNMVKCGTVPEEQERAVAWAERWNGPRPTQAPPVGEPA
jgi:hypothetical protein